MIVTLRLRDRRPSRFFVHGQEVLTAEEVYTQVDSVTPFGMFLCIAQNGYKDYTYINLSEIERYSTETEK